MMADVNPYTYLVKIDVQPVSVGTAFQKVSGITKLATGESTTLEFTQGVPMLINFWAAWCQPSIRYTSEIAKLSTNHKQVRMVSVSTDSDVEKAKDVVSSQNFEGLEQLHIGESTLDLEYGASKMPRVVLVDGNGHIVYIGHPMKIKL